VEHLVIEKITDGVITVRDGQKTSEMIVKVNESWRNLLKNPPPETKPLANPAVSTRPAATGVASPVRAAPGARIRTGAVSRPGATPTQAPQTAPVLQAITPSAVEKQPSPNPVPVTSPEAAAAPAPAGQEQAGEAVADIPPPPLPSEKDMIRIRLEEEVRASRITPEEAKKMAEMAQTLEQLEELQRQKSGGQPDANTPPDSNK
jgi:hypothetical protein